MKFKGGSTLFLIFDTNSIIDGYVGIYRSLYGVSATAGVYSGPFADSKLIGRRNALVHQALKL